MKKDIKMNRSDMEQNDYRVVIPFGDEKIIIRNLDRDLRNKIIEIVAESVEEDKELDIAMLINMLVEELTNVEFEVPITEIDNPSHQTRLILYYINEIITELSEEILLAGKMVANNKKVEIANKEEKEQLIKEAKEMQKKIENKEVPHRIVKKPQRSKGKISRR